MMLAELHDRLMQACENANIEEVKQCLDQGADPNFNIKSPINALHTAIQIDNHPITRLLIQHGAIVKEFVIQKALEKDKEYLSLLLPDFTSCQDKNLLLAVLQAAVNTDDLALAKHAIEQGAQAKSLFLYAIKDFGSTAILQLLIENGFDIHADNNILLSEWMGTSLVGEWGRKRAKREDFMVFICDYYLQKPKTIEKFISWRASDKSRLFRAGLSSNNFNMMKFAFLIGAEKNEAVNSALYHYYKANEKQFEETCYQMIQLLLASKIEFTEVSITNAVCFNYTELLDALSNANDLEYAFEMAYLYEKSTLCDYLAGKGISKEAQSFIKMKVSAFKGDLKGLRNAVNDGADINSLNEAMILTIINNDHRNILQYLLELGFVFDTTLNKALHEALNEHKAYESVSFLIELGFDISRIKQMPCDYQKRYPIMADMWKNRHSNIFDYTLYLAKEVHPKTQGKQKEETLQKLAALSNLPYVIKMSKEKSLVHK